MNVTDCLTGVEITYGEEIVAIAMIEAKKEYGISIVSGAGTYAPPISAISFPISGKYEDYKINADDNFASQHFLDLTGCSNWKETDKFIDAKPSLFFPKEYKDDVRFAKINDNIKRRKQKLEITTDIEHIEVEKRYYPMGWAFFKKDTWDFIQNGFEKSDIKSIQKALLKKLDAIDFNSKDLYMDLSELITNLSFKFYNPDNQVLCSRDSSYNYTAPYFMDDMYPLSLQTYDSIKRHIEEVFPQEYAGLEQIVNVYKTFRNYDKVIGVSSRLGSSSYVTPNDLIALTLKQKETILTEKYEDANDLYGCGYKTQEDIDRALKANLDIENSVSSMTSLMQLQSTTNNNRY